MAGNGWIQVWLHPGKAGSRYGWPAEGWIQVWLHPGGCGGGFPSPVTMGGVHFQKFHKNLHFGHFLAPKWWFWGPKWRFQARFLVMGRCLRQTPPQKSDFWDFQARFLVMGRCLRQTPPQKSDFWDSHSVPVWKSHRACGRAAGGGRSRQLRPHWCPPTHPRLLSPCWGG